MFGSKCYIRIGEHLRKFDAKCDEGIFLGHSTKSKALKCYNNKTQKIVESINVRVDESPEEPKETYSKQEEDEPGVAFWELVKKETSCKNQKDLSVPIPVEAATGEEEDEVEEEEEKQEEPARVIPRYVKLHHDLKQIIGDKDTGILTRRKVK